jgi:hypothetical protein
VNGEEAIMVRTLVRLVGLAAIALGLFAGCTMVPEQGNAIIGSIFIDSSLGWVYGDTEYHVLVYDSTQSIDPADELTVNDLSTVAHLHGTFPGAVADWYFTTNFVITDVPAGEYFVFVWIDLDDDGEYTADVDALGFYDYDTTSYWTRIKLEPVSPNVVVPAIGVVDIDVWCGELADPPPPPS